MLTKGWWKDETTIVTSTIFSRNEDEMKPKRYPENHSLLSSWGAFWTWEPVLVFGNLYIGSSVTAANWSGLENAGITHVINATTHCDNYFTDTLQYLRISIEDDSLASISEHLDQALQFIKSADKVLIHCHWGRSRSATVILYALIHLYNYTFQQAFKLLITRRPEVSINLNFLKELGCTDVEGLACE